MWCNLPALVRLADAWMAHAISAVAAARDYFQASIVAAELSEG
jgi:hypothetical protein